MAEQTVSFRIKAINDASAELARVAADLQKITAASSSSRGEIISWGNAWGTAKKGAADAGTALADLDKIAKQTAQGGLKDLLSDVPLVGGALSKLATNLSGFPALLGSVVGAGAAYIQWLRSVQAETTKTLDSTTALADAMGTK